MLAVSMNSGAGCRTVCSNMALFAPKHDADRQRQRHARLERMTEGVDQPAPDPAPAESRRRHCRQRRPSWCSSRRWSSGGSPSDIVAEIRWALAASARPARQSCHHFGGRRRGGRSGNRHQHGHGRSLAGPRADFEPALVQIDQPLDDRQTETGPFEPARSSPSWAWKNGSPSRATVVGSMPMPVSATLRATCRPRRVSDTCTSPPWIGELDGIGQQVDGDLAIGAFVAENLRQVRRHLDRNADPARLGHRFDHADARRQQRFRRELVDLQFELARLDLGHVQKHVDRVEQVQAALVDQVGIFALRSRRWPCRCRCAACRRTRRPR